MLLTSEKLTVCLIALGVSMFSAQEEPVCPQPCSCTFHLSLIVIKCNGQNLTTLPHLSGFENDQTTPKVDIYIHRNRVGYILRNSFFAISGRLRVLEIVENKQTIEIAASAFGIFAKSLEVLRIDPISGDLNSNLILFSSLTSLVELTISSRYEDNQDYILFNYFFKPDSNPLLRVLELHHCGLQDIATDSIGHLALGTLNLHNNRFTKIPQVVTSLAAKSLTHLFMANNFIRKIKHNYIPEDCKLQALDLSFNKLITIDRDALGKCSELKIVNLSHNLELVDIEFGTFRGLINLIINLDHSGISSLNFIKPEQVVALKIEGCNIPCSCEFHLKEIAIFGYRLRGTCVSVDTIDPGRTEHEVSNMDLKCEKNIENQNLEAETNICDSQFTDSLEDPELVTAEQSQTLLSTSQSNAGDASVILSLEISSSIVSDHTEMLQTIVPSSVVGMRSTEASMYSSSSVETTHIDSLYHQTAIPSESIINTPTTFILLERPPQLPETLPSSLPIESETVLTESSTPSFLPHEEPDNLRELSSLLTEQSEVEITQSLSQQIETPTQSLIQQQETLARSANKHQETAAQSLSQQQETLTQSPSIQQETPTQSQNQQLETPTQSLNQQLETSTQSLSQQLETPTQPQIETKAPSQRQEQITESPLSSQTPLLQEEMETGEPSKSRAESTTLALPLFEHESESVIETSNEDVIKPHLELRLDVEPLRIFQPQEEMKSSQISNLLETSIADNLQQASTSPKIPGKKIAFSPEHARPPFDTFSPICNSANHGTSSEVTQTPVPSFFHRSRSANLKCSRHSSGNHVPLCRRQHSKDRHLNRIRETAGLPRRNSTEGVSQKTDQDFQFWILKNPLCVLACFVHGCLTFVVFLTPDQGRLTKG